MIRIRGKEYDVSEFRHIHPGGSEILDLCIGEPDSTALFESYHALCDQSGIAAIMRKYEHVVDRGSDHGSVHGSVRGSVRGFDHSSDHGSDRGSVRGSDHGQSYSFASDGFYATVRSRVRQYFAITRGRTSVANSKKASKASAAAVSAAAVSAAAVSAAAVSAAAESDSLRAYVKVTCGWRATVLLLWAGFATLQYQSLFRPDGVVRTVCSFASGVLLAGLVFNVTSNAITHGLSTSASTNKTLSLIHQPLVLSSHLLATVHSLRHHRSTGDFEMDPNMSNLLPFFRKSKFQPITRWTVGGCSDKLLIVAFVLSQAVFPGAMLAITVHYLIWVRTGHLWNMRLPKMSAPIRVFENFIQTLIAGAYYYAMIRYGGSYHTLVHLGGLNIAYFVGSAPNHDTYDSQLSNENNTASTTAADWSRLWDDAPADWGKLQVDATANFVTKSAILTRFLGGTNYHIEHHLFPTICSHRLAEIAPIVRACCAEFDIPYTTIDSPIFAFGQVFDMLIRVVNLPMSAPPERWLYGTTTI
jgi:fatty acid desaturase